ncbi:MAG: hypothetical protein D3916_19095, partial [Candidatus Electrothrix sp. MAN1_4]|nr:hypothetical protein [Candidatus Electrothrix sp. MAN1_4]
MVGQRVSVIDEAAVEKQKQHTPNTYQTNFSLTDILLLLVFQEGTSTNESKHNTLFENKKSFPRERRGDKAAIIDQPLMSLKLKGSPSKEKDESVVKSETEEAVENFQSHHPLGDAATGSNDNNNNDAPDGGSITKKGDEKGKRSETNPNPYHR